MSRARLAALVTKDLETFTLDLRGVSDSCGHAWAYPPPVESFPAIPGPHWPRLTGYVALGGRIHAEDQQPRRTSTMAVGAMGGECRQWAKTGRYRFGAACVFTHVGPARKTGGGNKRKAGAGGESTDDSVAASGVVPGEPPAKRAKGKGKAGGGEVAQVMGAAAAAVAAAAAAEVAAVPVAAAAAAAAAAWRRAGGASPARRRPRLTNRGTGLAPQWGRGRS